MMRYTFILATFFYLLNHSAFAQTNKIDGLKKLVYSLQDKDKKLQAIFSLCEERTSLHTDTLYKYALMAKAIATERNLKHYITLAEYDIAFCLAKNERLDTSLHIIDGILNQYRDNNSQKDIYTKFAMLKARVLDRSNKHLEALSQLYHVLNTAENNADTLTQIMAKTGIGWVQMEMGQYKEALDWFYNALNTSGNVKYLKEYSALYSNMAAAFNALNKNDSAEYFINKAIVNARQSETLTFLATSLTIQSDIFMDTQREALAEAPLKEALQIRKQIGDPYYIVYDMARLATFYSNINQPEKGIQLCMAGIEIAKKNGLTSQLVSIYQALANNYKTAGNTDNYAATLQNLISLKDSLYTINSAKEIAEMQAKYDVQKKENIIIQQKLDLVRKNLLFYGSLGLLLLSLIAGVIILSGFRKRQKLKLQIMQQEEKRLAARAVTEAEESERKRIAADLHDNLGAYAAAIIANIDDIMKNKSNMNASTFEYLKNNAGEIMNSLRETIWTLNKEKISLTGITDRFKIYVQKIIPAYPSVKTEITENIVNDISFSPLQALNVFRVLQEAFTNALKHSGATLINIFFESNSRLYIGIKDNGKGITDINYMNNGNGIKNMKARALESALHLSVVENETGGTEISLHGNPVSVTSKSIL